MHSESKTFYLVVLVVVLVIIGILAAGRARTLSIYGGDAAKHGFFRKLTKTGVMVAPLALLAL